MQFKNELSITMSFILVLQKYPILQNDLQQIHL